MPRRTANAIWEGTLKEGKGTVGVGSGLEGRVAHNRRCVMRDGTVRTLALSAGDPNILYVEGPIDPELGVLTATTEDLRMVAMLLHHTCHPCHGNGMNYVTSGWPGAWSEEIRRSFGRECVPLVLNGCCGNIHHRDRLNPDFHHADDHYRLGGYLAETTLDVLKHGMTYLDQPQLGYRTMRVKIPCRPLDPEEVDAARALVEESAEPLWVNEEHTAVEWRWVIAVALLEMAEAHKATPDLDYEIQVFRIGNSAIVGLGGEPYVEGQLEIKLRSPAHRTFVAHMTNNSAGYLPTRQAFERGGFTTWNANWSQLVPEALETVVEATIGLLEDVFE